MELTDEKRKKLMGLQKQIEDINNYTAEDIKDMKHLYFIQTGKKVKDITIRRQLRRSISKLQAQAQAIMRNK